jgi:hypothetical protein
MGLKIVCSGFLLRYPLGGFSFHHLQYLLGFRQLGHAVTYFEDYGWNDSCYDPRGDAMTSDPSFGLTYLNALLRAHGMADRWTYLAEDGSQYGLSRSELSDAIREADLYVNLSNINWIPELEQCRRRVLVDTDPVFTQIDGHGMGGAFDRYHLRFTFGENVHQPDCTMPDGGARWLPTRQPVVLEMWKPRGGDVGAPFTTVMSWSAYGAHEFDGKIYGQKDMEFAPFIDLPRQTGHRMQLAIGAPVNIERLLSDGGWEIINARQATRDPGAYQAFIRSSRAEFCVAKHGYVSTKCGWFSDRSTAYLASGRPVVLQDAGFSRFLPCGEGLITFRTPAEAVAGLARLADGYERHCRAARAIVEEYFDARKVLTSLLERAL